MSERRGQAVPIGPEAVLREFIGRMNAWEKACAATGKTQTDELERIFRDCCTPKRRAYGRVSAPHYSEPPDYDLGKEKVRSVETQGPGKVTIRTSAFQGEFPVEHLYVVKRIHGRWLLDNRKRVAHGRVSAWTL